MVEPQIQGEQSTQAMEQWTRCLLLCSFVKDNGSMLIHASTCDLEMPYSHMPRHLLWEVFAGVQGTWVITSFG